MPSHCAFFCQENRDHQATANDFIDIYLDEVQAGIESSISIMLTQLLILGQSNP